MSPIGPQRTALWIGAVGTFAAAVAAVIVAGAGVGACGAITASSPESTFGTFAPLICDSGEDLRFQATKRSYHRPGESGPHIACVDAKGHPRDVTGSALFTVLGSTFGLLFLLTFAPLVAAAWLLPGRFLKPKP